LVELKQLAIYEAQFLAALFSHLLPQEMLARFPLAEVSGEQVFAASIGQRFQGATLRDWMAGAERNRMKAIERSIGAGYLAGKTSDQIIEEIRGVPAEGKNGKLAASRRGLGSITGTALGQAAPAARAAFYRANNRLIVAEQWVSVLDNRTSEMCRIRDGRRYTSVDHKPIGHEIPWLEGPGALHCRCRSLSTPVFRGLGGLDEIEPVIRMSMGGPVAATMTYGQWLARQPADIQDEILGPTRGQLMRRGGMSLEQMYSSQGEFLTLAELRASDEAAFRRAGL
jgi:hypothetical protein